MAAEQTQLVRIWYNELEPQNERVGAVVKQAASDMMDTNMRLYIDQQRSWAARANAIGVTRGLESWDLTFVPLILPAFLARGKRSSERACLKQLVQHAEEFVNSLKLNVFAVDTATVLLRDADRTRMNFGEEMPIVVLRLWYRRAAADATALQHLVEMNRKVGAEMHELAEATTVRGGSCLEDSEG